jgi:two-component system CheB/CheR fusion protein
MPLISNTGVLLGASITFLDVTRVQHLQNELLNSRQELETTYEELQSTVEELETTNEELQSTNEELETMNEEMRQRTVELDQVNGFLESILTSLRAGVIVVDQNLHVQVWNSRVEDLWGVRADEAEREHFLNLEIGLPVGELKQPIRACLSGESAYRETVLDAVNRRGKKIKCRVTCTPLTKKSGEINGAIILMEDLEVEMVS